MATHSSVLAWRIPGMGEPGGLPSLGSHRVGQDWSDLAAAAYHNFNNTIPFNWYPIIYFIRLFLMNFRASLVAYMVKNLPAIWETRVWSLGWEDPLEKEMATHSSILAWRILWTEEPGELQSMGSQSQTWLGDWHTHKHNEHLHSFQWSATQTWWRKSLSLRICASLIIFLGYISRCELHPQHLLSTWHIVRLNMNLLNKRIS